MASDISTLYSPRELKVHHESIKVSVPLSDEKAMPALVGFLDFAAFEIILATMLIVLNILACARRSGRLAADAFAAGR